VIELAGLGDCEKSLRYAGFEALIDDAEVESHGDRRGLVGASIEKFAIEHDGNGNQAGLAFAGELNQADRARSGIGSLTARLLDEFLGKEAIGEEREGSGCHRDRQDDARCPVTI